MPTELTTEHVSALAPDATSLKAGQKLANARTWVSLGRSEQALWGECKGSSATPYRTQVDLAAGTPATRCSCPSRKFPCKHALGLLLLYASTPQQIGEQQQPLWVTEWIEGRAKKQAAKEEKPAEKTERSTEATAKRTSTREARVAAGVQDLCRWLDDMLRQGLVVAQQQPHSYWASMAARMVDSQAPGLARLVRGLGEAATSGQGWQDRLVARMGRLHMLLQASTRIEEFPPATQADIRTALGWTYPREELLAQEGTRDRWAVLGRSLSEDEGLRTQRTWLRGERGGQPALVLEFAAPGQPLDRSLVPGTAIDAELVFYPSAAPMRAIVKQLHETTPRAPRPAGGTSDQALAAAAAILSASPWQETFPALLADVTPALAGDAWQLVDANGQTLPLARQFERGWQALAISGGRTITVFGEWDGERLLPLGAWAEDGWVSLVEER